MPEVMYKTVLLDKIIDFEETTTNGSWFTKTIVNNNKGSIPVYGASLDENEASYGFVKDNLVVEKNNKQYKVKYFEDCLTWNIDGSVGVFYRRGKFSLSEKVIPLLLKDEFKEYIDLGYLKYEIELSSEKSNFGFSNKAGKEKLKVLTVNIPITKEGIYDINKQKEIVEKYELIDQRKSEIKELLEYINDVNVDFSHDKDTNFTSKSITDLFKISLGDGKFTKTYSLNNQGQYPLYSGKTEGEYSYINTFEFDGTYLTWAKDGLAGYIMYHDNEKFSVTNHRGILTLKEGIENIDLRYIKILLEPLFRKYKKGRLATGGKNEYTTLSKEMIKAIKEKLLIPIKSDGSYDLEKQQDIVNKYETIQRIKVEITSRALPFTLIKPNISSELTYLGL